ncbi:hypothetical protein F511_10820 [Dorcoceras hygrometricum]|uniref:Uncharacterized protein n=1 Tax=Dorcoceras hygrometricum TaxID=472368 RepID=A0A2Z7C4V5_9LAMI|nr:hypothetical protein F511_10820 [Dorcoceras hygrometricum]
MTSSELLSAGLTLSVLEFDPLSLWGRLSCFPACVSGYQGFSAGRGVDPTGNAPGGR